jgi:hypothetical protein
MSKMYIEILKSDTLDAIQRFSGAQYNLAPNNIRQEIHLGQSVGSNFTKPKNNDTDNRKRNLSNVTAKYETIEEDDLHEEGATRKRQKIELSQSMGSDPVNVYRGNQKTIYTTKTLSPIEIPPK